MPISTKAITIGSTPPTQNTDCQPWAGISQEASSPPTTPPIGKPVHNTLTSAARRCRGAYSEVRLMKLGIAPPSPSPARKRITSSDCRLSANAVATVSTPKQSVLATSTFLRPMRSATSPSTKEPMARPASAALNTMPKRGIGICSAAAIPGAASPIDCRSIPSSSATSPHRTMMRICIDPSR